MTTKDISHQHHETFESIKQINEYGQEYWSARQLAKVLEYINYRNFQPVVEKAKEACKNSHQSVPDHFADMRNMVEIGSGSRRELQDILLTRYACYLIVQNGDPSKPVIANGQTYFAMQTRRQELQQLPFESLSEDERRLVLRSDLSAYNRMLVSTAHQAGVETSLDYAIFQDHGYKGLYGGLSSKDIHAQKGLKKSQKILDHMGSTELAANLFRTTQTEEKLRRDSVQGKSNANAVHHEVGAKVRKTIEELGGIMPEKLPTPEKSIQQIEPRNIKKIKR
jgi:DNA-damage-inducible protein D